MISFYNIFTVAKIEVRTLLRSWFFRIFSAIAIIFLGFWDFATLSKVTHSPWAFRGISSTIPYVSIMFLNSVQAVIAVFLASDFLKRDKKLDTTEVVYMRSMTNGDYVFGKTFGILFVFLILNVMVLALSLIMQLILAEVPVAWTAYLIYPLVISLPTLVFILGLSFFMMVLIRNQAVTFIVILGYIATTLFFLAGKFNALFDYMAYNVPLMYSSITGFGDIFTLLLHRGIYLVLGMSMISFTIILLKRLPQSRAMTVVSRVSAFALLFLAIAMMVVYTGNIRSGVKLRKEIVSLGNELSDTPVPTPVSCDIKIVHKNSRISAEASLTVTNDTPSSIDRIVMRLNPGLEVEKVLSGGGALGFEREKQILYISPSKTIDPGDTLSFIVSYSGTIDEDACYPYILEEDRAAVSRLEHADMINIGKRYSFVGRDYVLLTPETLWYPAAGPGYSSEHPENHRRDFIDFSLDVTTAPELQAVSQGYAETTGEGRYSFKPEFLLPSLTLSIGNFEYRSIEVDSVEYGLYIIEGHDFFSDNFTDLGDTISTLIRDLRNEAELKLGLEYPYRRLTLLEVPIHFHSYRQLWSVAQETVQPEIVLLPEKGLPFRSVDFRRIQRRMKRRRERTNETTSAIEDQSTILTSFLSRTLLASASNFRFGQNNDNPFAFSPSYNIFPNFITFTNKVDSEEWPILTMAMEAFYAGKLEESSPSFVRFITGLSPEERVNLALSEKTLEKMISDVDKRDMAYYAIKTKGDYLFLLMKSMLGEKDFDQFLGELLQNHRFRKLPVDTLVDEIRGRFGFDIASQIKDWYDSVELPGYLSGMVRSYKVLDGDRERYQVTLTISNPEPSDGLVEITFRRRRGPGRGGFMRGPFGRRSQGDDEDLVRQVRINAGENLDLGFVLDYQPGTVEINTLISKNIPSVIKVNLPEFELEKKAVPFDGQRPAQRPVSFIEPGEIIVDNEDPGFMQEQKETKSLLKKMLPDRGVDEDEKYHGMVYWKNVSGWLPTTNSKFFGKYVRSAHYTNKGDGDKKVSWNAEIADGGFHDIYYYVSKISPPWHRRSEEQQFGKNHFLIHHDDGTEETEIDLDSAEEGWNFLGSFYISPGTATVEMTNKSDKGRFVTADAVKWIKR
ncbi:MAG: hypothetical protein KAV42_06480 [Candidatus Krumholzibacteria bacterium]|nr:hypothetical protein [Candidatus Krumholzibacteria bacterium]